jgi:hypothetical protein
MAGEGALSAFSLLLVGGAAVMHATWNFATKKARGGQVFLALCSACALLAFAGPVAWIVAERGPPFLLAGGARLIGTRDARARAGLYWGACTGLFIASYTVVDGYAVRVLAVSPLFVDYATHVLAREPRAAGVAR